jgi:3-oxoacyl-[acyl-carrier protein] reductase
VTGFPAGPRHAFYAGEQSSEDAMDLGLKGRTAIVCAASKGLGRGCAEALAAEGVALTICARTRADIEAAAAEIAAAHGVTVTPVAADVKTAEGRAALLAACPDPDILVNNAGGPPPGDFRDFDEDDWRAAVEGNMIAPLSLIRAVIYGMADRGFGRVVNITSASVKSPIPTLELSNGARAGLTGAVASLARKVARHGVTVNGLLPGPFDTARQTAINAAIAAASGRPEAEVNAERMAANPAGRFGTIEEFGAACAFLCSRHGGFITGQNLVMDGGAFNATM